MLKQTCSKCHNPLEPDRIGKYRYCLACHKAANKVYREKKKEEVDGMKTVIKKLNPVIRELQKSKIKL